MTWLDLRYRAEYLVFRVLVCVLQAMSPRRCVWLAETLAFFVFRVLPRKLTRYEVARQNIQTAFRGRYTEKQIDEIIFRMWVHLFRMIAEITHLTRKFHVNNAFSVLSFRNRSDIVRPLCSERPVIVLSGHYGNWEMSLSSLGVFGFPINVVARDLDNPYLHNWFFRFRQATGHQMIGKKGAFGRMASVLEQGGNIALLCDQDAGLRGTFVDFFDRKASTFPTIARLAIEFQAYICVGYSRRLPDDFENHEWVHFEMGCEEVVDPLLFQGDDAIQQITQQFTRALERLIRRSPEQYLWAHRRWKTSPQQAEANKRIRRKKAG